MKQLPRIFRILLASLSLFNLIVLIERHDLSKIVSLVLDKYNEKILKPVRFFFQPIHDFISENFHFTLPEWWIHLLVIWLFIGAVTVSALKKVDEVTGQGQKENYVMGVISDFFLSLLGAFLLLNVVFDWIRYELILEKTDRQQKGYAPGFKILFLEFCLAFIAIAFFFSLNAFTL